MSRVFLDMAVSLDGFVSGPSGEDGGLHDWYFAPAGASVLVLDELLRDIGAMVLGRRTFGEQPEGFDTPYKVPHFVLTHEAREPVENGGATFYFVSDGLGSAVARAKAAAGERDVCASGGAATAQALLQAGLIDEVQLHLVPKLFGGGLRLFENVRADLERTRVLEGEGVTHLRFRVRKGKG